MKNSLNRTKQVKAVILSLAVLLVLLLTAFVVDFLDKRKAEESNVDPLVEIAEMREESQNIVRYKGKWYSENQSLETFLLFGVDKYSKDIGESDDGYLNTQQADFFLLLVIDKDAEIVTPIMLNRDTMTEIQLLGVNGEETGTFTGQLALAHTYGTGGKDSCRNTVKAVSNFLFNVQIDHYISLTMDAVEIVNDLVDGVKVKVTDDFSLVDPSLVMGEEVTLHGSQALTYVRSRANVGEQTNISRMQRQKEYLAALTEKLLQYSRESDTFAMKAAIEIGDYMVSDCTSGQLSDFTNEMANYEILPFASIEGEARKGEFMEFYPEKESLQSIVITTFFEEQENAQ